MIEKDWQGYGTIKVKLFNPMTKCTSKHAGSMKRNTGGTKIFHTVIRHHSQIVASYFPNIPVVR